MKKYLLSFAVLSLLLGLPYLCYGQSEISVNARPDGFKNASKARSIAFTNTLSPIGLGMGTVALTENNTLETVGASLAVYGLLMGPSTGNFHVSDYKRGGLGVAVRGVGMYLLADATREVFGNDFADALTVDDQKVSFRDTKIIIGGVLVVGSILYNIASINASVQEYNENRGRFTLQLDSEVVDRKVAPMLTAQIKL